MAAGHQGSLTARFVAAAACALPIILLAAINAAPAGAAIGYEQDPSQPTISLGGGYPHGIAVDQEDGRLYVAVLSTSSLGDAPGLVAQLGSNGAATAASPFGADMQAFFSGVAVNPLTRGIFAAQVSAPAPGGGFQGETRMHLFSSAGVAGASFGLSTAHQALPQIAADSEGNVYYPNDATDIVEIFDSTGGLKEINCASCPGGAFAAPATVAIDAAGNLYILDFGTDRVVKFVPSGDTYVYSSLLQSGKGAVALGVDPGTGDVFVGDLPSGRDFHIVAYDSSGAQFDDFGSGLFADPIYPQLAGQIAANATTHRLYVATQGGIVVFRRAPIQLPQATTNAASSVGQIAATLNATVNANGHAVIDCSFQYTEAVDTSYADAKTVQCPILPSGTSNRAITARPASLEPSTAYRYRIMAENNGGSTTGNDETFETLPVLPATVSTEAALSVTQTTATLTGKVNPHGGSVSDCHFEYGSTPSYGTSIACRRLPGAGTTATPESVAVSGLTADTDYYYRLVVTSNAGTSGGGQIAFRTLSPAPAPALSPEVPSSPPPLVSSPPAEERKSAPRGRRCPRHSRKVRVRGRARCRCRKGFRRSRARRKVTCTKKHGKHRKRRRKGKHCRRSASAPRCIKPASFRNK